MPWASSSTIPSNGRHATTAALARTRAAQLGSGRARHACPTGSAMSSMPQAAPPSVGTI
ncbi:hypothetical protein FHS95_002376 [Sphingomonas naasensis]|nr:hypothetical protein [Sphingomonas naasensis]NIJ20684.1 hypothetical protein [Sphingomonas naasensis]